MSAGISGDITLVWNNTALSADFQVVGGDLLTGGSLRTAILISLFTDRYAEEGDVLPEGGTDRRGWWGDAFPNVEGDRTGSRLWLLARAKQTADVLERAGEYAREALQWLLDDGVASALTVTPEFITTPARGLALTVQVQQPDQDPTTYRFGRIWEDL